MILFADPFLKSRLAVFAIATAGWSEGIFVIDLPADHTGIIGKGARHLRRNSEREPPVSLVCGTGEPASAWVKFLATLVYFENFRIFLAQPRGRRGRRSSEDYGNFVFSQDVHCPMQPRKIKFPFSGLHQRPGKFRDANIGDAGLGHHARVFFPQRLRRLVGIIINPEEKPARRRVLCTCVRGFGPKGKTNASSTQNRDRAAHESASVKRFQFDLPPWSVYFRTCFGRKITALILRDLKAKDCNSKDRLIGPRRTQRIEHQSAYGRQSAAMLRADTW